MIGQLTTNQPIDLRRTLDCGQGHRWRKENRWYTSILKVHDPKPSDIDKPVWIRQRDNAPIEYKYETVAEQSGIEAKLRWQFRLKDDDEDVREIYAHLERDDKMKGLVNRYLGLRVMRVDPWECLVFFLLARRAEVEVTHQRMEDIANKFGEGQEPLENGRYPFPSAEVVGSLSGLDKLKELTLGFPKAATYIHNAGQAVHEKGVVQDEYLCDRYRYFEGLVALKSSKNAVDALQKIRPLSAASKTDNGVGLKTASCVALFGLGYLDAFPEDTHVSEAMRTEYARDPFQPFAGYANQFLFMHDYNRKRK